MAKGGPVGDEEEKAILEALKAGRGVRAVAAEFDRAPSTISSVATRNGLDVAEHVLMKKRDLMRTCYNAEARIRLVGELLDKARSMLKTCDSSRDLQYLATSIAIGIDKRRLEEATDPSARGGEIRILFEKMQAGEVET
ncbi:MAG: helix-turn-helix domain-containing protein [Methanoregulaceae archaeon]|jgi:transposase-like protein|nr:helix-turn-helix domain-containing protein [Methanoregulaceae archaeon]